MCFAWLLWRWKLQLFQHRLARKLIGTVQFRHKKSVLHRQFKELILLFKDLNGLGPDTYRNTSLPIGTTISILVTLRVSLSGVPAKMRARQVALRDRIEQLSYGLLITECLSWELHLVLIFDGFNLGFYCLHCMKIMVYIYLFKEHLSLTFAILFYYCLLYYLLLLFGL